MAIVWHKLKTLNPKKAMLVVGLAGFTAFAISAALVSAAGPQFNIFPISYTAQVNHDLPLIDAKNITKGGGYSASAADHSDGVQADPGDVIEVSIYYHNGAANTPENIANNVLVRAFANPSLGGKNNTHILSATVGAGNAATVSSSAKGGDININVNGDLPQSLSLVPGSVKNYKNWGSSPNGGIVNLPDTIFSSGVNIGDVQGCWDFHGFVNFRLRVSEDQPVGNLHIIKQVRNVTGNSGFASQVNANPGDQVEYKIEVSATQNTVNNVTVKDALDNRLSLDGYVKLDGTNINSSGFFGNGVNIGNVTTGAKKTITFNARVAQRSSFSTGVYYLDNTATAFSGSLSVNSSAKVKVEIAQVPVVCNLEWNNPHVSSTDSRGLRRVYDSTDSERETKGRSNVNVHITGLEPNQGFQTKNQHVSGAPVIVSGVDYANAQGVYDRYSSDRILGSQYTKNGDYEVFIMVNNVTVAECRGFRLEAPSVRDVNIDKTAKNLNTGQGYADTVSAKPSEQIMFKLVVTAGSSNTAVENIMVKDILPNKLVYVADTLNVDGSTGYNENTFFGAGINIGTIQPNQSKTITFKASVSGAANFNVGQCELLINTGTATATGLSDSDTGKVNVCKDAPVKEDGQPGSRPN